MEKNKKNNFFFSDYICFFFFFLVYSIFIRCNVAKDVIDIFYEIDLTLSLFL